MSKKSPYIIIAILTLLIVLVTVLNVMSKNASRDDERPEAFPKGEMSELSEFADAVVDDMKETSENR